jgi:hypothetical protein
MAMTPGAAASRIFYGRWVALALAIIVLLSSGVRFTIDPFLKPVTADLGLDRGSFSLVVAASLFLYGRSCLWSGASSTGWERAWSARRARS